VKTAALQKVDNNDKMYFFVVNEFKNDVVRGKLLHPNQNGDYMFSKETENDITDFPYGFDLVYYGDTFGEIPFEEMQVRIKTNPLMPYKTQ
jgi:hypothetical protein